MNFLYNIVRQAIIIYDIEYKDLSNIDPDTGGIDVITPDTQIKFKYEIRINGSKCCGFMTEFATDLSDDLDSLVSSIIHDKVEELCKECVLDYYFMIYDEFEY